MRNMTLLALLLLVPALALAQGAEPPKPAEPAKKGGGGVRVKVEGAESAKGAIRVALFTAKAGFPDIEKAARVHATGAKTETVETLFSTVPAGKVAVLAFHDVNDDGKLPEDVFGNYQEPYGFSLNPNTTFGMPDFDVVAFEVIPGKYATVTIKLHR